MAIPESQLNTWSHQGSIDQSASTYNSIRNVLLSSDTSYAENDYTVFLQGSYGNDTNIYSESDVDIVILLSSCFYYDKEVLSTVQSDAFTQTYSDSTLNNFDFKKAVQSVLYDKYGDAVTSGDKAITIEAGGSRRSADVIVATEHRAYYKSEGSFVNSYHSGICFFDKKNNKIVNYPKQHSQNCTEKHKATNQWYKPMVRIFKNMRGKLVGDGIIEDGLAPSYYLEGLLYNVPNDKFGRSYGDSFANCINWIYAADRSKFVCANERYYLLRENSQVTWREAKCEEFLNAARDLWNSW